MAAWARRGLVAACALAASTAPGQIFDDVPFAQVGGRTMPMDIRLPTDGSAGPWPLVIFVHGGAGRSGSHNTTPPYINVLPSQGIAVASVQYRLASEAGLWGDEPVIFPAQIHDVKGAVRFLRANASTYNIDPGRFAAWGPSAGGHLVVLLATSGGVPELEGDVGGSLAHSSSVQVAVDCYGPTDLLNMQLDITIPPGSSIDHDASSSGESALIGFDGPGKGIGVLRANQENPAPPFPEKVLLATQANPITWIDAGDPPILIAHGENDSTVPTNQSQRLADALAAAGVGHELRRVVGMGHHLPPAATSEEAHAFVVDQWSAGASVSDWQQME